MDVVTHTPKDDAWQMAVRHRQAGPLEDAEAELRRAIELEPVNPSLHINLGDLLRDRNLPDAALAAYSQAIKCAPDCAAAHNARGVFLAGMKGFDEALADHRRAIELSPEDISLHLAMIKTNQAKGDFVEAERGCRRALEVDAASAQVWECLGTVLQTVGRFDEAAACLRRSLEILPSGFVSMLLSRMPGQSQSADEQRIVALLKKPDLPPRERAAAGFALGDLLDQADRFDEAFAAYASANALFKEYSAQQGEFFDSEDLRRKVDEMIETCTPEFFRHRADFGQMSELPVFVVGMPRSGTSLVEQILASHSKVFGAGELPDIATIRARFGEMILNDSPRHWQRHWHRHLGKLHLAKLAMQAGDKARVVDKMPGNILHLGLIATLFPKARVIFCERDSRATCLSCFFQLFQQHNLMFSYDLGDCARQYRQQERLAAHWKQVLPLRMLSMQYEELVTDLETQSRRLIEFLGLDWEPNCLEFHRTDRPVLTKSVWQVRQPVYTRAVQRWKHYQKHLGPLLNALRA